MTALPESEAATSLLLKALFSNRRLMASATAVPSMIAPSTILSGGIGSMPTAVTLNVLPVARNSTALTALDPMSRPTTGLDFLDRPNTVCPHPQSRYHLRSRGGFAQIRRDLTKSVDLRAAVSRSPLTVPSAADGTAGGTFCVPRSLIGRSPLRLDSPPKRSYHQGLSLSDR